MGYIYIYIYISTTFTAKITLVVPPTKPSVDDDTWVRYGFRVELSFLQTQSALAVTYNIISLLLIIHHSAGINSLMQMQLLPFLIASKYISIFHLMRSWI